jgi:hypothetical protein
MSYQNPFIDLAFFLGGAVTFWAIVLNYRWK